MENHRVLFEGNNWEGSEALSARRGFERLGCLVLCADPQPVVPEMWSGPRLRAARRLLMSECIKQHNRNLLRIAGEFRPEIFLAYKGGYIAPATLRAIKALGAELYNFFPDLPGVRNRYSFLPESLAEYDCVFSAKTFFARLLAREGLNLKHCEFVPHGYDPQIHRPVPVAEADQAVYGGDVVFIGTWSPGKERTLSGLKGALPEIKLNIWGEHWDSGRASNLKGSIRGRPLTGIEYALGLTAPKIALGLLLEQRGGALERDLITSRTFNIPATGAFMLHERTDEVKEYYEEGEEIACFEGPEELAAKVRYYLGHPGERTAIAAAGYRRCVPAYSQDNRMKTILEWHEHRRGRAGP